MRNISASNARYMSYDEVASSFVITENYERLLTTSHSFIMGPRGCGKTTLLKMLNPYAAEKCDLLSNIPFWGIYIPSDQQWKSQFDSITYQFGKTSPMFAKQVSRAMVNINVLIAFCDTISSIWKNANIEEGENTFSFFDQLVALWKLEKPIAPTLSSVVLRLRSFLMDLDEVVNNGNLDFSFPYVCSVNFTNLLISGISVFEDTFYSQVFFQDNKKWAICMDEMEIAPEWLFSEVMSSMRSIDQRIIFKITAVPSQSIGNSKFIAATEGNDFHIIRVWNYNKQAQEEWASFAKIILSKMVLEPNGIEYSQLVDLISSYENMDYHIHPRNALNKVVESLRKIDESFYKYVLNKNVDLDKIDASDVKKRVMIFHYFTLLQRLKLLQASKSIDYNDNRLYDVYMNAWLLTEYCDGNPRTLINLFSELNDLIQYSKQNNRNKSIDIPAFAQKLRSFSCSKIYNRLAYQSMTPIIYKNKSYSYKEILDTIGEYLCNLVAQDIYYPNPENLFTCSSREFEPFIKVALESGAIVLIEDSSEYRGVRGKVPVYRLNYGLYPFYHIVKTSSKQVIYLEDIIEKSNYKKNENENSVN